MSEKDKNLPAPGAEAAAESLIWYHTIDLGDGQSTPGIYDHRPFLAHYGLPKDLRQRSALDIGAASGFFTFELERRGASVVATDLPTWMAHDFGPLYRPDLPPEQQDRYLLDPFCYAHARLHSLAERKLVNIYDLSPETVGRFDLVFCGSVLLHLSDPIRALWRIQSVTKEAAIIATNIHPLPDASPLALFSGQHHGDVWWLPNRAAFEAMVQCAGFKGWEWFSEFRLDYRNGEPGPYHAVIRAWNTPERPAILGDTDMPATGAGVRMEIRNEELDRLRAQVAGYERMRLVRLGKKIRRVREKIGKKLGRRTPEA